MQKLTVHGPADVIAYAWYRLGFVPRESVIVVGMLPGETRKHRCGVVVRFDIGERAGRGAALDALAGTLIRTGHHAVIVLIASQRAVGRATSRDAPLLQPGLARMAQRRLENSGLEVLDVLGLDEQHYRSYLCADQQCCPAPGLPLDLARASNVAATLVFAGESLAENESELFDDLVPADSPVLSANLLQARARPDREAILVLWSELLDGAPHFDASRPEQLADLCRAMVDVHLRDAVLVLTAGPPGAAGLALARSVFTGSGLTAFATIDEIPPEPERLQRARDALATAVRHAPQGRRGAVLAALSWMAWWSGSGHQARTLAERALADQSDNSLAGLVLRIAAVMIEPGWVRDSWPAARPPGALPEPPGPPEPPGGRSRDRAAG